MPVENLTIAAINADTTAQGPMRMPAIAFMVCCKGNILVGPTGMDIQPRAAPRAPNMATYTIILVLMILVLMGSPFY
ncbi:MAG: hypothetical protein AYK18_15990 [Theionarchaea archaeon DG-70]|nr:MAG: hypothetical protein AYK18_15990 [Theionarchaea archaeon DG-70]